MTAPGTLLQKIRRRARILSLNSRPGIQIAASASIAKGAMLQTACDGQSFVGRISVSEGVIISDGVILATYGATIAIAAHAYIGPYCVLYGHGRLTLHRKPLIGGRT